MVSALVEDLPTATADFLHRRARRAGADSVAAHVRHELITLARERAPLDDVVEVLAQDNPHRLEAEIDQHAQVLRRTYDLPIDVWGTLCRRAAAANVPVSVHVHDELVALSRRGTIDDVMSEFEELKAANPDMDIDLDAIREATLYARGSD